MGVFLAPFHPTTEDPTLAIERDLQLMEVLDRLGYEEAWIGEHHSAGFEIIASPEIFMAVAAERTRYLRLGSGVISLPYHHPLNVCNRMIQLDHMTRGRVMFGMGPGLLATDADMRGIAISDQRRFMAEGISAITRLMAGEVITEKTDWYEMRSARAHLLPYSRPRPELAVASTVTPSGGKMAGTYDLGMLCVAATADVGFDALDVNWSLAKEIAAKDGRTMDPQRLRLVGPMHLAATREQAFKNVEFGIEAWVDYFTTFNPAGQAGMMGSARELAEGMVESGTAVIGTPEDAIRQIERLKKKTGGFGVFLQLAHNWADFEQTCKSYELFARYVTPAVNGLNQSRADSLGWAKSQKEEMSERVVSAAIKTTEEIFKEQAGLEVVRSGKLFEVSG